MSKKFLKCAVYILIGVLALASFIVFAEDDAPFVQRFGLQPKIQFSDDEIAEMRAAHVAKMSEILDNKVLSGEITKEDADAFIERCKQAETFKKGAARRFNEESLSKMKEKRQNMFDARFKNQEQPGKRSFKNSRPAAGRFGRGGNFK
ncbi:MAG: hypothetical protein M0R40_06015 [Firmicutes bacterium]|nr:hypothetical protein [Bacillota bacterium]